jgi:hypothetical protein
VPSTGKKSSPYPYPLGRVPGGYRVPIPELPSLPFTLHAGRGEDKTAGETHMAEICRPTLQVRMLGTQDIKEGSRPGQDWHTQDNCKAEVKGKKSMSKGRQISVGLVWIRERDRKLRSCWG